MPINNVDLSAMLPLLTEARKPFDAAVAAADAVPQSARPSDNTLLGRFAPSAGIPLGALRQLMVTLDAIYNMAGVPRP